MEKLCDIQNNGVNQSKGCRNPEVPLRVEYELTEIGTEFKPVLESIEIWGNKYIEFLRQKNKKHI